MAFWNAGANDHREQVGTDDSENASDCCPDQPFEADQPQPPLEHDDREPDDSAESSIKSSAATKGLNEIAGNCNNKNK